MPETQRDIQIARVSGIALLLTILVGILAAVFIAHGIDVNMTADIAGTAENVGAAELRLRAKAYLAIVTFLLGLITFIGFYRLLKNQGNFVPALSLIAGISAAVLALLGSIFALNIAEIVSNSAFSNTNSVDHTTALTYLQIVSDYTSFHFSLIITSFANAGFFYLFLTSGRLPKLIAGWGLFASVFVLTIMVLRDFIPALGNGAVTASFMISNLIALVSTGLYMTVRGVKPGISAG